MIRLTSIKKQLVLCLLASSVVACSGGPTNALVGNSFDNDDGNGVVEGANGNTVIGEVGASGSVLRSGNVEMTVVIGQSVGIDSLSDGDMTISNTLGAAKFLSELTDE